ncbi:MAG: TerB family tellurite resistance protein [Reichenbachiella sp.]
MEKAHLSILIQLAKIDGEVAIEELDLINEVGKVNGFSQEQVKEMLDSEEPVGELTHVTDDQKYELIYSVVQLMKIDGKLYNDEIKYCAKMAAKLGYDEGVLFELMLKIYADPDMCANKEELKKTIQDYLIR